MILLVLFAFDKFIKALLFSTSSTLYINKGVLLGVSIDPGVFSILSIILLGLFILIYRKGSNQKIYIKMIAIGALMNISDRFIWGGVVDYINIFGILIINIADVIMLVGIINLIYTKYFDKKRYFIKS